VFDGRWTKRSDPGTEGVLSPSDTTRWWGLRRVAGRTRQRAFETGEQIDDVSSFEDSVAQLADVALMCRKGAERHERRKWQPIDK
jgi:hypothetical protein